MCEMFQEGADTLCWYGGRFCLWAFSGINTVLFIVVCIFVFVIFIFCNFSSCFLCKLFTTS
jgi:hypothetical protein